MSEAFQIISGGPVSFGKCGLWDFAVVKATVERRASEHRESEKQDEQYHFSIHVCLRAPRDGYKTEIRIPKEGALHAAMGQVTFPGRAASVLSYVATRELIDENKQHILPILADQLARHCVETFVEQQILFEPDIATAKPAWIMNGFAQGIPTIAEYIEKALTHIWPQ